MLKNCDIVRTFALFHGTFFLVKEFTASKNDILNYVCNMMKAHNYNTIYRKTYST